MGKGNPTLQQQSGVGERKLFMTNRELFPARKFYRFFGLDALGDFDMVRISLKKPVD